MPKFKPMVWILLGALIGCAALGGVFAAMHSGAEVRVAAKKHGDGRVEVAVQAKQADGSWGERQRPEQRFVPADAALDRWLTSSAVAVGEPGGAPRAVCLVHHGSDADVFWGAAELTARAGAASLGMQLTIKSSPDHARQAQLIRDCVAEGAEAIATSVPDADALRGAISEAQSANVLVVTFNSGRDDAASLKSPIHMALDEVAAGRIAGEAYDDAGVTGTILCVLHETDNVGLDQRCDGLEAGYSGGAVERFNVAGVGDLERTTEQLAERIRQGNIAGLITLNSQLISPAVRAVEKTDGECKIASFGSIDAAQAILADQLIFGIVDLPWVQAHYALSSISFYAQALDRGWDVEAISGAPLTVISIVPVVLDRELSQTWISRLPRRGGN